MKALSVHQPYANRIASGEKTIELRTRNTSHRGPLLIVAAKEGDGEPKGMALAIVDVIDSRPATQADTIAACAPVDPNEKAWILANVRRITPFPVRGRQGRFFRLTCRGDPRSRWDDRWSTSQNPSQRLARRPAKARSRRWSG